MQELAVDICDVETTSNTISDMPSEQSYTYSLSACLAIVQCLLLIANVSQYILMQTRDEKLNVLYCL